MKPSLLQPLSLLVATVLLTPPVTAGGGGDSHWLPESQRPLRRSERGISDLLGMIMGMRVDTPSLLRFEAAVLKGGLMNFQIRGVSMTDLSPLYLGPSLRYGSAHLHP